MSADDPFTLPSLDGAPPAAEHGHGEHGDLDEHERKKHKKKVRSAWISFIGRIIAQIAGAAATIVIGLAVLNQYPRDRQKAADPSRPASAAVLPARVDPSPDAIDLVVLPFEHLSPDPSQAYVAEGLAEATIAALACVEALHVVSRTSSLQYKAPHKSLGAIAAELAVDFVVEGAVTVSDGRVRVTAQLVDAAIDHEVWAKTYDRSLGDVLALQTELSAAIAREVTAAISSRRSIRWTPDAAAPCAPPEPSRESRTSLSGGRGGG